MAQIHHVALAIIRERTGLTQSDLARMSGVSQGRISELESRNVNVRPGTIKALADALKVPTIAITSDANAELAS